MLQLTVILEEVYDESTQTFDYKEKHIVLEHSLVSLSKWESKHEKSFLRTIEKGISEEEFLDYIRCMTITQNVGEEVYDRLSDKNISDILAYINAPMTATTVNSKPSPGTQKEVLTAEVIYYYMFSLNIPLECQKWHLNRLITLIEVFGAKGDTKKMGKQEIYRQNAELNKARRKALHSKG